MRIAILDGFTTDLGDGEVWRGLRDLGDLTVFTRTRPEDVLERCAGAEAVLTNKVSLDAVNMTPSLRYIGILATGTNVVDLEAARQRSIAVANIPGYSTESVAQLVFAFLLHFTQDVAGHNADVKAGKWAGAVDFCFTRQPLTELAGKTLAILGGGAIGSAVARIAKGFGMRVLLVQVPGSKSEERLPLKESLRQADFVTLHCPLTEKTKEMVNAEFLSAMKPCAILINTGRGQLIQEPDLIAALDSGHLGGVGLDVLYPEPPAANHPLLNPKAPWADKVVVTPHYAWATVEARMRLVEIATANLKAFLNGETLNRVA